MKGGMKNNATSVHRGITEGFGAIKIYGCSSQRLTEQACEATEMNAQPGGPGILPGGTGCDLHLRHPKGMSGKVQHGLLILEIRGRWAGEGWCRTYRFGKAHAAHSSVKHPQAQHV